MKRSRALALLLMGAGGFTLMACSEAEEETLAFESLEACIADGIKSPQECRDAYEQAKSQHAEVAPKFATRPDCEAEFAEQGCEEIVSREPGGGSWFIPVMAGYLMGRLVSGAGGRVYPQPLYRTSACINGSTPITDLRTGVTSCRTWRTASGRSVGSVGYGYSAARTLSRDTVAKPAATTQTLSRGGFGQTAQRMSSTRSSSGTSSSSFGG